MELITKSFASQCLAFPARVDQMLAKVETVEEAKDMLDRASAMKHYAEKLRGGIEIEKPIAIGVLKIKGKIGELLPAIPPQEKGAMKGKKDTSPAEVSFPSATIAAYRKIAANIDQLTDFCDSVDDVPTQTAFLKYVQDPHVANNSVENEWYTPAAYVDAARDVMRVIDLDPASSEKAQETVQASTYYSMDDDGLSRVWFGNVWLNPPYSKDLIGRFTERMRLAYEEKQIAQSITLVNNATETAWFQKIASVASAFCFCAGRIKFNDSSGNPANSPLQGQCFIYMGDSSERFASVFASFGLVCTK